MNKARLEAFTDGVMAIVITIMVLDMKAPHDVTFAAMLPILPVFISYVLSFVYVAIYWINHHMVLHASTTVTRRVLWANLHLLFWISLIPFATSWLGENHLNALPVALYGFVLLMCSCSFFLFERILVEDSPDAPIKKAGMRYRRERFSIMAYCIAIPMSAIHIAISVTIYIITAVLWIIPDHDLRQIESSGPSNMKDKENPQR